MDTEIPVLFKIVAEHLHKRLDAVLGEVGVTFSQARLLIVLEASGGRMTQRKIEDEMLLSHAAVHGIVLRLCAKSFVSVSRAQGDRRQVVVSLSQSGRQVVGRIREVSETPFRKVLSERDRASIFAMLSKIVDAIRQTRV